MMLHPLMCVFVCIDGKMCVVTLPSAFTMRLFHQHLDFVLVLYARQSLSKLTFALT